MLINYEMPWNPMRVEQRIGRIDRIGQEYDRVWIRNYFYDGTVEATVYQRLDIRIASFESVVGELQPILTQVAKVIEAAAMANDKQRGELIKKEIDELNRQVQSAEVAALNLDKFTSDTVEAAAVIPAPVTLPELERTLVGSQALRDRMRPHPKIVGAHLLDWHGRWQEVTFDPQLYDAHPNTLRLMSYGSGLLEDVLSVIQPPAALVKSGTLGRCSLTAAWPIVAYYEAGSGRMVPSLANLWAYLHVCRVDPVDDDCRSRMERQFTDSVLPRLRQEEKAAENRHKAQVSSLTEEIRQLLVEVAYVELAMAANRDLFDESLPLDFSEQAYQRLKRHKVPFAGALKIAGSALPRPYPDDAIYLRHLATNRDGLQRRFGAIRSKLVDLLKELMSAKSVHDSHSHDSARPNVDVCWYTSVALLGRVRDQS